MSRIFPLALIFSLLFQTAAVAAFYKYTDRSGGVVVTNDYKSIPKDLRGTTVEVVPRDTRAPSAPPAEKRETPRPPTAAVALSEAPPAPTLRETLPERLKEHRTGLAATALLIVAGIAGFACAANVGRRPGYENMASRLRKGLLLFVVAGIVLVNVDLLKSLFRMTAEKGGDIKRSIDEAREKDKKPLKTLEEVVMEKAEKAVEGK